jgi:hypothetical protein
MGAGDAFGAPAEGFGSGVGLAGDPAFPAVCGDWAPTTPAAPSVREAIIRTFRNIMRVMFFLLRRCLGSSVAGRDDESHGDEVNELCGNRAGTALGG